MIRIPFSGGSSADLHIEFQKDRDALEVIIISLQILDSQSEIFNLIHHAGLKKILKELIVGNAAACFHLYYEPSVPVMSVGIKGFLWLPIQAKQNGHRDLVRPFFPSLYSETGCAQPGSDPK